VFEGDARETRGDVAMIRRQVALSSPPRRIVGCVLQYFSVRCSA
jgi:hypothetical protein